jgi:hypothetical protein
MNELGKNPVQTSGPPRKEKREKKKNVGGLFWTGISLLPDLSPGVCACVELPSAARKKKKKSKTRPQTTPTLERETF